MTAIAAQTKRVPMSREEFDRLPEGPPFYDYVNGEAVELNRPSVRHQQIMIRLSNRLREHAEANDLGLVAADVDVALPTGNVFAPDIVFVSKDHLDNYNEEKGDIYGVPDLIVEIHSASTRGYDRLEKRESYHAAQVPWLWYVEQETLTIEELQWTPQGYLFVGGADPGKIFTSKLFTELEINLQALMGRGEKNERR